MNRSNERKKITFRLFFALKIINYFFIKIPYITRKQLDYFYALKLKIMSVIEMGTFEKAKKTKQ